MSDDVTRLAEVLAEHELVGKAVPARGWREHGCPMVVRSACQCQQIVIGCTGCEWESEADGTQGDAHRAHVAEVIAPLIAEARLLGATQAKSDAIDAHAELVARIERLLQIAEYRDAISVSRDLDGRPFKSSISQDDLRAALNDPTEETTP